MTLTQESLAEIEIAGFTDAYDYKPPHGLKSYFKHLTGCEELHGKCMRAYREGYAFGRVRRAPSQATELLTYPSVFVRFDKGHVRYGTVVGESKRYDHTGEVYMYLVALDVGSTVEEVWVDPWDIEWLVTPTSAGGV